MKVAIVGAAPTSRHLAPVDDPTWQIWTCSPSNRTKISRVDSWFELHPIIDLQSERWGDWAPEYTAFLSALPCPVYMQEVNSLVPNAVALPKDAIVAEFGSMFLTSSMAFMICKAILDGATEIGIWGVDCSANGEYEYERPGCQHFIKVARDRGITVTIPPQSDLDAPMPIYGYGDANPVTIKLKMHAFELRDRIGVMESRLAQLELEKSRLLIDTQHLRGALEENIYIRRTFYAWSGTDA